MIPKLNKNKLQELLNGKLPGYSAQAKMEPEHRIRTSAGNDCREAAVLLLLYTDQDTLRVVFMKRNEYDGPHSGQISFPGGMKEESDADLKITALRETEEETGVPMCDIEILGALSSILIPVSNFCVFPFVGWVDKRPEFNPDKSEVQYLICPSLEDILDTANRKYGNIERRGNQISTPYFEFDGEIIWGATAMVLMEFIALLGY